MSLSLISEDVPKIALGGFGFVFFFFLIQLGSIANSDTNSIIFGRVLCLVKRVAHRHRHAELCFPALQFAVLPTAPPFLFWLIVNSFEKKNFFGKKNQVKKKEIKEEGSCVPSRF